MFALEIDFHDGVSSPEVLLIRRPIALVGTSEFAHVVIDGAAANLAELRIFREIEGGFSCQVNSRDRGAENSRKDESFDKFARLELGEVTTSVTSLDYDLAVRPEESPDSAALRIAQEALTSRAPKLPALALLGAKTVFVSILANTGVVLGRSRKSLIRLDAPDVSGEHARMGYDNNSFWIEDLGSTNGTFVEGERISGRVNFIPGQRVRLGGETVIGGVEKAQDVELYRNIEGEAKQDDPRGKYPCVVSNSELIKPARIPLVLGRTISMGRDPSNDIWVGASHISRNHCYVTFEDSGTVSVKDESSNGTFLGESKLNKGEATDIVSDNSIIHLGSELCIKVCFDKASEETFLEEHKQIEPEFVKESDINAMELTSLSAKAVSPATDDPENRIEGDGVFAKLARKRSSESNLLNPVLDPNRMQSKLSTQSIQRKNSSRLITSLALVFCILILLGWIAYNLYRII